MFFSIIVLLFLGGSAGGESTRPDHPIYSEDPGIQIDGRLEEPVWSSRLPISSFHQQVPYEGEEPSERTEMWLLYDKEYLYLGAKLYTRDPASIVVRSLERDSFLSDQDAFALILDTSNDNRTAFGFIVNPAGVRTDIAVYNDGEGHMDPWNKDWNAFWDAAAQQSSEGWTVEARIPFSSLRFKVRNGAAKMGLIAWRFIASNSELNIYPAVPNKWRFSAYKPSMAKDIILAEINSGHPIYIRPYLLGGFGQQSELNAAGTGYLRTDHWEREPGLDIKYNLASNLILDVTLNTDFAQVEVDDEQVNLTRFSLFFPEKRTFFQERADLFDFKLPGGQQRLFHTRTIGIVEGRNVPILGGVRLTGQVGDWEVGFMEMQTGESEYENGTLPSENFGILRLKRLLLEDGSYIGAMITSRYDLKDDYNVMTAVDLDLRLKYPHYCSLYLAHTFQPDADPQKSRMGTLIFRNRIRRGFTYGFSGTHIGIDFNPAMGFLFRTGINRFGSMIGYTWFPATSPLLQNHTINGRFEFIRNIEAGIFETGNYTLNWSAQLRSGSTASLELKYTREELLESFTLGEVAIEPGRYLFWYGGLKGKSPAGLPFRCDIEAKSGGYYGGRQFSSTISPAWTLSPHISVRVDYNFNYAFLKNGIYNAHVVRLRLQPAINNKLSANLYLQYNSDIHQFSSNFRFRYNPSEGVDVYLVYNEGINTDLELEDPRLPRTFSRTVLLKFNYTFVF